MTPMMDPSTSLANYTYGHLAELCRNQTEDITSTAITHVGGGVNSHDRPSAIYVWGIGLLFVTLINMCAVVGIGVMRYLTKNTYNQVRKITVITLRIITLFVGLGVGSLSGSSFYHLLPQAHPALMDEVDENGKPTHSYLHMAHISILGVYAFFFCDKLIKIILEIRKKNQHIHHRRLSIENPGIMNTERSDSAMVTDAGDKELLRSVLKKGMMSRADVDETEMMTLADKSGKSMGDQAHGICVHDHSIEFRAGDSAIAAVAWMIVFGDGLHNFIDGISIGAAFAESIHSGLSISLAVLCEEFPHELGDVAILVASGMSLKQALVYNLLSAITCYVGFFIGVGIGELGPDTSKYAFGLAGGMFLYISLACMMPEMKKAMEEALNVSLRHGIYVLFLQTVGLFSGLSLMYIMARYGESITIPS
ncbi:Protein CBG13990 [Caenorhabditis briggsae]|uniref:Protein CBG13990 n=1 Tax=Caenorhabditis briggsae TaxID=6238 RepID=A8XIW1_CAEBR|nr:Protein CBG13990 [Caenorhabditis briggsae]CAP32586.2 Protein CBG13990 [Caenorhabditis briggsae]